MRKVALFFLLLALAGCAKHWSGNAQDFVFNNFNTGKQVHLKSYAGKPLVLNFWADW